MKLPYFIYIPYVEAIFSVLHANCGCIHRGSVHCGFAYLWKNYCAALMHCAVGSLVISVCNCIGMSNTQEAKSPEPSNSVATWMWCLTCKHKIDVFMCRRRQSNCTAGLSAQVICLCPSSCTDNHHGSFQP